MPSPRSLARVSARAAVPLLVSLTLPAGALAASSNDTQLLVKFRSGTSAAAAARSMSIVHGQQVRTIPDLGVRVINVPASSAVAARAALDADGDVAFAESNAVAKPMEDAPNNPYFPQGNLSLGGGAWGWYQTHTTQAWDLTQGSPSVVIAVLDSGLKPQGLNFGGQIVPGYDVLTGTTDTTTNAGSHGTYVAGAAVGVAGSDNGNAGYCPDCSIMPVQVGTDSGFQYSDLATGITWATNHGAKIINMSLGGTAASSTVASAVSYAQSKGVILFAAAGNSNNTTPMYPAATPGVIGVAGVAVNGVKSGDSDYGSWVAMAAPEGDMTAWPTLNGAPGYAQVGGTSLASPAAAGIAGLIWSEDPSLTAAQLTQVLESSATAVPFTVGYGEVDAMAALRSVGYSDPQSATAPVNTSAPSMLVETNGAYDTAPLSGAPQVGQVLVRGPGAWTGSSPLSLSAVEWDRCATDGSSCTAVGTDSTYTVQSADGGYSLQLKVTYADPNGSTTAVSSLSPAVGSAVPASPPANTSAPAISGTAQSGQTMSASTGTWSNSPTSYTYQWSRCDSTGANCAAVAGATGSSYAVSGSDVGDTLQVTVTASNSGGSSTASSSATAVVAAGTQTSTFSGSLGRKGGSQSYSVTVGAGTASSALSYSGSSNLTMTIKSGATTVATVTGPSVLTLSQTLAAGSYTFLVSGTSASKFTLSVSAMS